jgi:hypothetical protein
MEIFLVIVAWLFIGLLAINIVSLWSLPRSDSDIADSWKMVLFGPIALMSLVIGLTIYLVLAMYDVIGRTIAWSDPGFLGTKIHDWWRERKR